MITKGVSHIGGIRSLHTRLGPNTQSSGLLKLHQLAAEKESLMKKLEWIKGQKEQTEKRLSEITFMMQAVEKQVEEKTRRELVSNAQAGFRKPSLKY